MKKKAQGSHDTNKKLNKDKNSSEERRGETPEVKNI